MRRKDQRTAAAAGLAAWIAAMLFCAGASAGPKKKPPGKPIDLNRATLSQLEELPGVGPETARAILRFRERSGPFERVEDLLAVRGISRGRFEKIRPYVFVGRKKDPAKCCGAGRSKSPGGWLPQPRWD